MTQDAPRTPAAPAPGQLDPRGPQFGAWITVVLLAVVLASAPSTVAVVVLAVQTLFFALGAALGVARTPYAWLFRTLVRPRLAAPSEWEDPQPPRFAQTVGLVFAVVGLVGLLTGATTLALVAVGFAFAAALLNAAFGFCLGCEMYLLGKRLVGPSGRAA